MKRILATLISCFVLFSTTVSAPAFATTGSAIPAFSASSSKASDTVQGSPSNLNGVTWDAGYTTCTLQANATVAAPDLATEIASHVDSLTTFIAQDNTRLTGDADRLFQGCSLLSTVTLSNSFNTSAVTSMFYMFAGCTSLTSLTLPESFDTSSVGSMESMFEECSALTSLDLPRAFNTSQVLVMFNMFRNCSHLQKLDLSMFSSEKLIGCIGMFANCDNLKELNLGNFVPPAGEGSLGMFADIDFETSEVGSIPSIEKITMSGSCILEPGEGTTADTASGTFFDYKEPLSWSAYYQGNTAEGRSSDQSARNNLSAEPTAVLTGFDEFKAYQETHPGLTTYVFDGQPTPPAPTPEPNPDATPATDTDTLPLTGDTPASLISAAVAVLMGTLALLASGYSFTRKRLQ